MKELLIAGAIACSLLGQQTGPQQNGQTAQTNGQTGGQTKQNSAIPDAPRPQPVLSGVAPGKAPVASSSADADAATPPTSTSTTETAAEASSEDKYQPNPNDPPLQTLVLRANIVDVPFIIKDSKGRLVPGITARDVRVYENGLRQKMDFFTVDPFPLSVALVIDQSLDYQTMGRVNDALGALQAAFTSYDEVAVFSYNNGPKLLTTFTAGQSPRLSTVLEYSAKGKGRDPIYADTGPMSRGIYLNDGSLANQTPLTAGGPGSPQGVRGQQVEREVHTLNDAVLEAGKALSKTAKGRRRIIYVISDGKEYGSTAKQKDVIRYLQSNEVSVWGTLTGDSSVEGLGFLDRYHLPLFMRDNVLRAYTDATGGQTFAEFRSKAIANSFSLITEQVRTQYTLGFTTHLDPLNEKFRTLEVTVLRPNLQVFAKKGYYPTAIAIRPQEPQKTGLTPSPKTD
ncbi:MAG: VWA domain-containing protein [Janthinobacterium lividum]